MVRAGGDIAYALRVRNVSRIPITVTVRDMLPAGAVLREVPAGVRLVGGTVAWNIPRLMPGASRVLPLGAQVAGDRRPRVCNAARATATGDERITVRVRMCTAITARRAVQAPAVDGEG